MTTLAVANRRSAQLKSYAPHLVPRGPPVEVVFSGEGPIGMHVVQASDTKVLVAAPALGLQAATTHRVRFGDQVIAVGSVDTTGGKLTMKEVKALMVDAPRPVSIFLQPLGLSGQREPLVPPPMVGENPIAAAAKKPAPAKPARSALSGWRRKKSEAEEPPAAEIIEDDDVTLWSFRSRAWAFEPVGEPFELTVEAHAEAFESIPSETLPPAPGLFSTPIAENTFKLILVEHPPGCGNVVEAVNGATSGFTKQDACKKGNVLTLQRVEATDARSCHVCGARGWKQAKFCHKCGAKTGA